jgi:hypothetical protein
MMAEVQGSPVKSPALQFYESPAEAFKRGTQEAF